MVRKGFKGAASGKNVENLTSRDITATAAGKKVDPEAFSQLLGEQIRTGRVSPTDLALKSGGVETKIVEPGGGATKREGEKYDVSYSREDVKPLYGMS